MPVTGAVDLAPVRGIEVPVTAFVDDTHTSVYTVDRGVVRTTTVVDVRSDGANAIVTGIAAGTVIVKDIESANIGNGDHVTVGATGK
jgi:hypothetical protein